MPTELNDETGTVLQNEGREFGTVTGRPRRCGWFDAELVSFTSKLNGFTDIALTKLDVLDTLPKIKICVGYHPKGENGKLAHYWEGDARWLEGYEPEYIEMDGWLQSTKAGAPVRVASQASPGICATDRGAGGDPDFVCFSRSGAQLRLIHLKQLGLYL